MRDSPAFSLRVDLASHHHRLGFSDLALGVVGTRLNEQVSLIRVFIVS